MNNCVQLKKFARPYNYEYHHLLEPPKHGGDCVIFFPRLSQRAGVSAYSGACVGGGKWACVWGGRVCGGGVKWVCVWGRGLSGRVCVLCGRLSVCVCVCGGRAWY